MMKKKFYLLPFFGTEKRPIVRRDIKPSCEDNTGDPCCTTKTSLLKYDPSQQSLLGDDYFSSSPELAHPPPFEEIIGYGDGKTAGGNGLEDNSGGSNAPVFNQDENGYAIGWNSNEAGDNKGPRDWEFTS